MRMFAKRIECGQLPGAVASWRSARKREQAPRTPYASRGPRRLALLSALCVWPACFWLQTSVTAQTLNLPARPTNALSGMEFLRRITPLELAAREREVFAQVTSGNVPDF